MKLTASQKSAPSLSTNFTSLKMCCPTRNPLYEIMYTINILPSPDPERGAPIVQSNSPSFCAPRLPSPGAATWQGRQLPWVRLQRLSPGNPGFIGSNTALGLRRAPSTVVCSTTRPCVPVGCQALYQLLEMIQN